MRAAIIAVAIAAPIPLSGCTDPFGPAPTPSDPALNLSQDQPASPDATEVFEQSDHDWAVAASAPMSILAPSLTLHDSMASYSTPSGSTTRGEAPY